MVLLKSSARVRSRPASPRGPIMRLKVLLLSAFFLLGAAYSAPTQEAKKESDSAPEKGSDSAKKPAGKEKSGADEEKPIVTKHEVTIQGKHLNYKVTTGLMPLKDDQDKTEAQIFYMAYTAE